jgi:hypothetical protein
LCLTSLYLQDVKVWLPDVQFDKMSDSPCGC